MSHEGCARTHVCTHMVAHTSTHTPSTVDPFTLHCRFVSACLPACPIRQSDLVQRIAELVEAKVIEGVADVRDESDRTGVVAPVHLSLNHI